MNTTPARLFPTDPLFPVQWHLYNTGNTPGSQPGFDINVVSVWPDYTGKGVLVAAMDQGMDPNHPDLLDNYRHDLSWDVDTNQRGGSAKVDTQNHGVPVTGLVAAQANNGIGGVGVAWDAQITSYRSGLDETTTDPALAQAYRWASEKILANGVDVWTNSWTPSLWPFSIQDYQEHYLAVTRSVAEQGRGGLGTITLFAAGNARDDKLDTNDNPTDIMPWSITVAASDQKGALTSYSTPGAGLLITSPGSDPRTIVTTDRSGSDGYNTLPGEAGNYTDTAESHFNGTSAATPIAAGVVALMLQANPGLGYRDVQEILAYSAKRATFLNQNYDKGYNGARDWNGGGLLNSHDFGYGHIDAHAAVRLAESWTHTSTTSNLVLQKGSPAQSTAYVATKSTHELTARFDADYRVEHMTVRVNLLTHELQHVTLELISPDGTVSTLINRPPVFAPEPTEPGPQTGDSGLPFALDYTLMTVRNWGENLNGDWVLRLRNDSDTQPVHLNDWSITAYTPGNHKQAGTQIFTNEFARFAQEQPNRTTISSDNGTTLNAAIITSDTVVNLTSAHASLGGVAVNLTDAHALKNIFSGDGNDTLTGNGHSNVLLAGRGNNLIDGAGGVDVLRLIGDRANYLIDRDANNQILVNSTTLSGGGLDRVSNTEVLQFADQVVLIDTPVQLGPDLFDETGYLARNPDVALAVQDGSLANGYQHYQQWGGHERRDPNALFNEAWYLSTYQDVATAVQAGVLGTGYQHYMAFGWAENRAPAPWMDATAYLSGNPDVMAAGMNPLAHYLGYGVHEGRVLTALEPDLWG